MAAPTVVGGLSEGLTPSQALVEYFLEEFATNLDVPALIERGRGILEAVSS